MAINQKKTKPGQTDDFLRIQDLLYLCLAEWKWFVLSLVVTCGVAVIYLLRTPPVYTRTASVLIKEDTKGNSISSGMESFSELGLFQSNTNVNNELLAFQSPAVMTEVVKRLNLGTNYYLPGRFHQQVAYGTSLPATVSFADLSENESGSFTLDLLSGRQVVLADFTRNGERMSSEKVKGNMGDTLVTPLGRMVVTPTVNYD